MALPPFNINQAIPGDTDVISGHPSNARTFRDITESWLLLVSDTYGRAKIAKGSTATRDALVGPVDGTLFINSDFTPLLLQRYNGATWDNVGGVTATEGTAGIIEIATQAETDTGTDDARAVTPLKLTSWAPAVAAVTLDPANDYVLVADASDAGKVKKVLANTIPGITPFSKEYISANQTFAIGGQVGPLAHGLGVVPKHVAIDLICTTGEHGYSPGDVVQYRYGLDGENANYGAGGIACKKDATNITLRIGNSRVALPRFTDGQGVNLTPANWAIRVSAWA